MDSLTKKRLLWSVAGLIAVMALVTALLLCRNYFARGKNMYAVDMRQYMKVDKNPRGDYLVSVDADKIIKDFYLPDPKTTDLDLSLYPDVAAVYSLAFIQTQQGEAYYMELGSNYPNIAEALQQGRLYLTNTAFYVDRISLEELYRKEMAYPRRLSMQSYLLCGLSEQGSYIVTVDKEKLLHDCGWQLPENEEQRHLHKGYEAVMSLGFLVNAVEEAYRLETTSTVPQAVQDLKDNGIELFDTVWTMTLEDIEALYRAQNP